MGEYSSLPFHWTDHILVYGVPYEIEQQFPLIRALSQESSESDWIACLHSLKGYHFYLCYAANNEQRSQLFPSPQWTFQHHAAYCNAPQVVVEEMIKLKYPLSYRDNHGKLPVDYVQDDRPAEYKDLFKPKGLCQKVGLSNILQMERNLHKIITERASTFLKKETTILPMLSVYYENINYHNSADTTYFSIPGLDLSFCYGVEKIWDYELEMEEEVEDAWEVKINPNVIILSLFRVPDYVLGRIYRITENNWTVVEDHFY